MNDQELIEKAKRCLANCKLTGAETEFLEELTAWGFDDGDRPQERNHARNQRTKVNRILRDNGIL